MTSSMQRARRRPGLLMAVLALVCMAGVFAWFSSRRNGGTTPADDARAMVDHQLRDRGIRDPRVLRAMTRVPRERFVPPEHRGDAFDDGPLPIGHGQTISQPYIVALMTEAAKVGPEDTVLDIGTGSGYQAAVLGEICRQVYSIEIVPELADTAGRRLAELGYKNIEVRSGDGYRGWPEHAPFRAIVLAAAPDHVPQPLVEQLAIGGRLIMPVGRHAQQLLVIEKQADGSTTETHLTAVAFVPMTGEADRGPQPAVGQ